MAPLSSLPGSAPPESLSCQQCTRECYCPNGRRGPWGGSRRRGVPQPDANEGEGTHGGHKVGCSLGALRSAQGWIVTARAVAEMVVGAAVESAIRAASEYTGVEAGVHRGMRGSGQALLRFGAPPPRAVRAVACLSRAVPAAALPPRPPSPVVGRVASQPMPGSQPSKWSANAPAGTSSRMCSYTGDGGAAPAVPHECSRHTTARPPPPVRQRQPRPRQPVPFGPFEPLPTLLLMRQTPIWVGCWGGRDR